MVDKAELRKPSLYVLGDSGTDEFVLHPHEAKERRVDFPSGALFDLEVLSRLLADLYDVTSLVKKVTKEDEGLAIKALEPNAALISDYKGTSRISGYEPSSKQKPTLALKMPADGVSTGFESSLFVAHHAGLDWSNSALDVCDAFVNSLTGKASAWPLPTFPRVLVNLSSVLPTGTLDKDRKVHFKSKLWSQLYQKRDQVGIVMSVSTLRAESAVISRRLSIEHIVEDLCSDLHLFPNLNVLGSFSHIFVRVGMIAVVHLYHVTDSVSNNRFAGEEFLLYADHGLHRDSEQDGGTLGRTALLIAALARGLAEADPLTEWAPFLQRACMRALLAMKVMDDNGYRFETGISGVDVITHAVGEAADALKKTQPGSDNINAFGWRSIPDHVLAPPQYAVQRQRWHILDDVCLEAPVHRINIAMAIVVGGYRKVLNQAWSASAQTNDQVLSLLQRVEDRNPHDRAPDFVTLQDGYKPAMPQWPGHDAFPTPPIIGDLSKPFELNVPVMAFGKLDLVERDEIESLRSIANLLRLHRAQVQQAAPEKRIEKKPISVAVFGPPGSGKGFAVKQLATTVGKSSDIPVLEFNVAQFGGVHDLFVALEEVARKQPADVGDMVITPLVFFDEFDCAPGAEELAWLKYFLAPMQDGTVKEKRIGPAIFVFAGGVYANFSRFDPRTDTAYDNLRDSEEYRQRLTKFVGQKGPDFISRLRGHIDILPINDLPGRPKHFIRRAMQLRSLLALNQFVDKTGVANIDDALVYAFLTVDRYHHGVRSMQAIVEMCSPLYGRLEISSMPSRAQLDMHVDAEEFMVRVRRGRERKRQEYQYKMEASADAPSAIGG